ncbi:Thioredoxin [Oopsacas minuta]|uniref:Thioredoxin n=1 Tax=Oopsacas minuta TaxID=111878 RepID=A0AAV7KAC2_9METZ|nr:Thioredoxin [Oopsacas minuta]
MPTEIDNQSTFKQELKGNDKVVVDYYAVWCGPCNAFSPKFIELEAEFPTIKFLKVDVDKCPGISKEYKIAAMPTFLTFHKEDQFDKLVGANEKKLRNILQKLQDKE